MASTSFKRLQQDGLYKFRKNKEKLSASYLKRISSNISDFENAYLHAYTSAKIAYEDNENKARRFGYLKEIFTEKKEIKNFGSRYYAYLDTNRDLWNNDMGIKYALYGKSKGKTFEEVADDIFNNIWNK